MIESLELYKRDRQQFVRLIKAKDVEIEKMRYNEKQHWILSKEMADLKSMRKFIHDADQLAIHAHKIITESEDMANSYQDEIDKLERCLTLMVVNETIKYTLPPMSGDDEFNNQYQDNE